MDDENRKLTTEQETLTDGELLETSVWEKVSDPGDPNFVFKTPPLGPLDKVDMSRSYLGGKIPKLGMVKGFE